MNSAQRFDLPTITDEDVSWASAVMGLQNTAFRGVDGKDPRLEILKSNDTFDVEACPGSGKTTLLVAKLAILARKWSDRRRGLCVLSHTNVARREIEQRLGNTAEARRLLSYPHFIGTIHSFVNEFLAIPWLRSKQYPIRMIDDEVCLARRWKRLNPKIRAGLEKNKHDQTCLGIHTTEFSVGDLRWGRGILGTSTPTYKQIRDVCKRSTEEGFLCYDEMFIWANELLDRVQNIQSSLRDRFPVLFIDEVQDNSELQSAMLHRLFTEGGNPVIRQRFGDSNQSIYDSSSQTQGAATDVFPMINIRKDIPNSYRFGQAIADFANPFAPRPQGLVGCGPSSRVIASDATGKHAVFLFDDQTLEGVMAAYGGYLLELFTEQELRTGVFTAVGGVHKPASDDNLPRSVGHYWKDYDYELTAADPKPRTLLQYVHAGRKLAANSCENQFVVEKTAEGILRLADILNPLAQLGNRRRKHRQIRELLADKPVVRANYLAILTALSDKNYAPDAEEWDAKWVAIICAVAQEIAGVSTSTNEATQFLEWRVLPQSDTDAKTSQSGDNMFRFPKNNPKVNIRMGSIHSVKGETHTATLVLDTYFHEHSLAALKGWLLGEKSGRGTEGIRNFSRLKQVYVAMTRPSHLICLAMREDSLTTMDIPRLKVKSWRVARVNPTATEWL